MVKKNKQTKTKQTETGEGCSLYWMLIFKFSLYPYRYQDFWKKQKKRREEKFCFLRMDQLWNFGHVCAWGEGAEVGMMNYRVVVGGGGGEQIMFNNSKTIFFYTNK